MRFGNCKGCKNLHEQPWGSKCEYMKSAKLEANVKGSEDDWADYLRIDLMKKPQTQDSVVDVALFDENGELLKPPQAAGADKFQQLFDLVNNQATLINKLSDDMRDLRMGQTATATASGGTLPPGAWTPGALPPVTLPVSSTGNFPPTSVPAGTGGGGATVAGMMYPPTTSITSSVMTPGMGGIPGIPSPQWPNYSTAPPGFIPTSSYPAGYVPPFNMGGGIPQQSMSAGMFGGTPLQNPSVAMFGLPHVGVQQSHHVPSDFNVLVQALDPQTAAKSKGMYLRPEYYAQNICRGLPLKQMDYTKLNVLDLWSGMIRVAQFCSRYGYNQNDYLEHMSFVAEMARSRAYTDVGLINYERYVTDNFLLGVKGTFVAGDPLGQSLHLNTNHVSASSHNEAGMGVSGQSYSPMGSAKKRNKKKKVKFCNSNLPDAFPADICYDWNYNVCSGGCSREHVCRNCRKGHRGPGCPTSGPSAKRD